MRNTKNTKNAQKVLISQTTKNTQNTQNIGTLANNPLNIRYSSANHWVGLHPTSPSLRGFCHFISAAHGYRAAVVLLKRYITHYHLTTPTQLITRWAPPTENRTQLYIAAVCGRSGLKSDEAIAPDGLKLCRLVAAMARQETGMHITAEGVQEIRQNFGV